MSDALLFSVDDGIATLTINRPAQRNAINIEVNSRLYEAWETIDSRPDIRVAILTKSRHPVLKPVSIREAKPGLVGPHAAAQPWS
ncbi:P-hydroxycinnamoyl CoA hydratase/lyase family protein [Bordetella bronchiseptica B18-5 (C3)]|nr:P-hydroxycinnamoyl CoA hydratase/lyase family protein [Bordetella bronchiseptica B18-5 (C3)]